MSRDARDLYIYLLTCPHNNQLCCFRLGLGYAADDLQWDQESVKKAMAELTGTRSPDGTPMVIRDEETLLTMVYGQLEKEGIVNKNCAISCVKVLDTLPTSSPVYDEIFKACERMDKPHLEPLTERLRERLGERFPKQQEQEQEQEQEEEKNPSDYSCSEQASLGSEQAEDGLRPEGDEKANRDTGKGPESPVVLEVPLIKRDGFFQITKALVEQWQDTFPGVDAMAELKRLRQWNLDHPKRRKTRTGFKSHVSL